MCGRAKLETDVSEIKIAFRIPPEYPTPNFAPSWNVAPTDRLPIVRYDQKAGSRTLDLMRWGLVAVLGEGHQDRLLDHQCDGRDRRHQACCGSAKPATTCCPRSSSSNKAPICWRVVSATSKEFGAASACRRAAKFG